MSIEQQMILRSTQLVQQIAEAEKLKQPIDDLVKQHIRLLKQYRDVFVHKADKNNFSAIDKVGGEIQIWGNIRAWANKIGLPVDEYTQKIFELRASLFGEEGARKLFND